MLTGTINRTENRTPRTELCTVSPVTKHICSYTHIISPTSIIQCCSAYQKCNCTHGHNPSGYPTENASRTAAIFSDELGTADKGQVGSRDSKSIPHKLSLGDEPNSKATPPQFNQSQASLVDQKVTELQKKGAAIDAVRGRILLHPLSGTKEGWRSETSNKSKVSEQPHVHSSLQNGGDSHAKNPITARRLACKGRPEECLFLHPDTPRPQEIPVLSTRSEQSLPVHLPSIRPRHQHPGSLPRPSGLLQPSYKSWGCE